MTVASFDHLVGNGEHARWNGETKHLCGFEVDHKLEFGGLHDWKIGRLFALENAAGVDANLAKGIGKTGSIAHQSAGRGEVTPIIDRGNCMACRQCQKLITSALEKRIDLHQEPAPSLFRDGRE